MLKKISPHAPEKSGAFFYSSIPLIPANSAATGLSLFEF